MERHLTSGVRVEGTGSFATLEQNQIAGRDPSSTSGRASIEVVQGAGATIRANVVGDNCIDYTLGGGTMGTANQWRRNTGVTAIPAGICGPS